MGQIIIFYSMLVFSVTFPIGIIMNFESDACSVFVFFLQIHIFFDFRIGEGCLKIWYNGVSSATFCSFFPGYQSVTGDCSWLVSCTGWHIDIGRRCKEESESGYTNIVFVLFWLSRFCRLLKTVLLLWQLVFYVFNPSLVATNLAKTITLESVVQLWVLICNAMCGGEAWIL